MIPRWLLGGWALSLAGCAHLTVSEPPRLNQALAQTPGGSQLAQLMDGPLQERLHSLNRSTTVFIPRQWPETYWKCLRAHPAWAQLEARRYLLPLRWGMHLPSTTALYLSSLGPDVRTLLVTGDQEAQVDGQRVLALTRWENGNAVQLAHPFKPLAHSPCQGADPIMSAP